MSNNNFFENKVEEALQLLSAHIEQVEKQTLLMEEFLARMANMQAEHNLSAYLMEVKDKEDAAAF